MSLIGRSTNSITLGLVFLFLIFPVYFHSIPVDTSRVTLWAVVLFGIGTGTSIRFRQSPHWLTICLCIVMLFYILIISLFRQNIEPTFILFYLEKFILLPIAVYWVTVYLAKSSIDNVKITILYVLVFQCLVILINIAIPESKGFVSEFVKLPGAAEMYPFRNLGITGFLSYSNGFLLFIAFYILEGIKRPYPKVLLQVLTFIIAVAFSRSSIVIYAVYLSIRGFDSLLRMKFDTNILKFILLLFLTFLTFMLFFYSYIPPAILEWILNIFVTILRGEAPSGLIVLNQQIWLPPDLTLFFGDARFSGEDGGYYQSTDVGYMRYVLYFGVVGLFLHFLIILSVFTPLFRLQEQRYKHLLMTYLITVLILTYKGNFIMDTSGLLAMIFALNPRLYSRNLVH